MRFARSSRYPCWLLLLPATPPPATMAWSPRSFWRHPPRTRATFSTTSCRMLPTQNLPGHADAIVAAAIAAVDPAAAVRRHLSCQKGQLQLSQGHERAASEETSAFPIPEHVVCLLYTSPSPRDLSTSRMPSSA